jgi:hypothetical protein
MDNLSPSPMTVSLKFVLARYQAALAGLNRPKLLLSPEQALEILLTRDALQRALSADSQVLVEMLWSSGVARCLA